MKKPYVLLLSAIIFFAAGCGKEDVAEDNNNNTNNNNNNTNNNNNSDLCEGVTCPIGAGCYEDNCIDSLVGDYHWVGSWYSWTISQGTTGRGTIDDTSAITRVNDLTVFYDGYGYEYTTAYPGADTSHEYGFRDESFWGLAVLKFNRPVDDSAFYSSNTGGHGGGTSISLTGVKIH